MPKHALYCVVLVGIGRAAFGADLGVWGEVTPIREPDLLVFIHQRLEAMQQGGQLAHWQQEAAARVRAHVLRPTPVAGLTTTQRPETFYSDPSIVVKEPVRDASGRVLVPAGTRVSPLRVVPLAETLLFFDADDPRQVRWAEAHRRTAPVVKFVLTRGDIQRAQTALHARVYFDQGGYLVRRWGIRHIPCAVRQKGDQLEIQEFAVDDGAGE